jgi:hypothetical protein
MGGKFKYRSCYLTDLAKRAGVETSTLQDWFTQDDWIELIKLGWRPQRRKLTVPVVKYIMDKYLTDYDA